LVLVTINLSVTRTLRRAGLRVGFMGVRPDEIERVLNANLCRGCGYNLTGNISGICPECGRPAVGMGIASSDASPNAASGDLRQIL
jgi:rRNA maturation endonuclease Nob1